MILPDDELNRMAPCGICNICKKLLAGRDRKYMYVYRCIELWNLRNNKFFISKKKQKHCYFFKEQFLLWECHVTPVTEILELFVPLFRQIWGRRCFFWISKRLTCLDCDGLSRASERRQNEGFFWFSRLLMSSGFSDFTLITAGAEKMIMNEIKWRTGINSGCFSAMEFADKRDNTHNVFSMMRKPWASSSRTNISFLFG